ncbi:Protein AHNAK2 [Bienertia sinuspersici]
MEARIGDSTRWGFRGWYNGANWLEWPAFSSSSLEREWAGKEGAGGLEREGQGRGYIGSMEGGGEERGLCREQGMGGAAIGLNLCIPN